VVGRGAADMKGGDAAILAVLEHAGRPTTSRWSGVFYDREEGAWRTWNGLPEVLRTSRLIGTPSFAFVGEPTLVHGARGPASAASTPTSRSTAALATPARPWEGENAIIRARRVPDAGPRRCSRSRCSSTGWSSMTR